MSRDVELSALPFYGTNGPLQPGGCNLLVSLSFRMCKRKLSNLACIEI